MASSDLQSFCFRLLFRLGAARGRCDAINAGQSGPPIVVQTSLYLIKTMVTV